MGSGSFESQGGPEENAGKVYPCFRKHPQEWVQKFFTEDKMAAAPNTKHSPETIVCHSSMVDVHLCGPMNMHEYGVFNIRGWDKSCYVACGQRNHLDKEISIQPWLICQSLVMSLQIYTCHGPPEDMYAMSM